MIQQLYTNEVTLTVLALPVLLPPVLVSPANSSTEIPQKVTLSWNSVSLATSYRIQVSEKPAFGTQPEMLYHDDVLTGTSIEYNDFSANSTYYWRVKSINASGESAYSGTFSFTTIQQITIPELVSPLDGYVNSGNTINLSWSAIQGVTTFRVQVFETLPNQTTFLDEDVVGTSKTISNLKLGASYSWRVRTSVSTTFSASRTFSVKTAPPDFPEIPILSSPLDKSINVPLDSVDLKWVPSARAETYQIQFDVHPYFGLTPDTSVEPIKTVTNLKPSTKYYWRVRALNISGPSAFSVTYSFTTVATVVSKPEIPDLVYPANFSTNMPASLNLIWSDSLRATSYEVHVSELQNFNGEMVEEVQSTLKTLTNLKYSTIYYWKVRARNSSGYSDYSTVQQFTTTEIIPDNPKPEIPVLLFPNNNSVGVPSDITLRWNPSRYATEYNISLREFDNVVLEKTTLVPSVTFTKLKNNTQYTWKVSAKNNNGISDYSIQWKFTTVAASDKTLPGLPILISPANGAKNVNINNIRFSWELAENAKSYEFNLSKFANFNTLEINRVMSDVLVNVSSLEKDITYYWRVRGVNSNVKGEYSYSSFSTISTNPIPLPPELIYPENGQKNIPRSFLLSWEASVGATLYNIIISKTSNFSTIILDTNTAFTTYNITGLEYGEAYYWKVRASNIYGNSDYSTTNLFTIIPKIPPIEPPPDSREFIYKYFPNNALEMYELYKRTLADNPRITLSEFVRLVQRTRKDIFVSLETTPTGTSLYPSKGDKVTVLGDTISIVWYAYDLSNVNIFFYKGSDKLLITNKAVKDGQNKYNIFIDNSLFSPDFQPCKIRIEMKENAAIYADSVPFKVLRVR